MRKSNWIVLFCCMFLVACQSPDNSELIKVEDDTELVEFVTNYKKTMIESVNDGHFNDVEPYLMANVSFYHSLRRYVNDLHSDGASKELKEFHVDHVYEDDVGDYYVEAFESVVIHYPNESEEIERYIRFEINRLNNDSLRIVTIREREE
ncbi:hypothetical protein [Halalkalibacter sp. APA_J-10(15)]|uniref:TcaA NTF2-like domain-containing protein n=1 Tax=Halalkalibacter sp. APA_J-10(15) TaxID=2933805 RepID=UPI001FF13F85|nr:hypothetical protein [Halalkalibacter sp. APA_J-10(15)]MCK0470631.1 hypothetical protein [Halalkalibacter sp. APA_J-10(15)]